MATATIERRYLVIKLKDARAYLTRDERTQLSSLMETVAHGRATHGRPPVSGIFIEEDWPEYIPARDALLARLNGQADLFAGE